MSENASSAREKLIVILGATAVGKSALALELAQKLQTEIISGDSMLVYRGLDIGTAKPTPKERQMVKHYLIDILSPQDEFNVSTFNQLAKEIITKCNERGLLPILAGGTGLYIQSLLEGYVFNRAEEDRKYRRYLEALAKEKGKLYVHQMLEKVDPLTAQRLHVNDFRRVVRALEVYQKGKERISEAKIYQGDKMVYDAFVIGLARKRETLYERINRRVDLMLEEGLENEVRDLLASGVPPHAQSLQGIGYADMVAYIRKEISFEEAVFNIKKKTRHFAKRQMTWYRRLPYIKWYLLDDISREELLIEVLKDVKKFFSKFDCAREK